MKKNIVLFSLLIILGLNNSCKKDPSTTIDTQQLWDCTIAQKFDSTKLADKLIGSWQWTEFSSDMENKHADKNIKVTFEKTGTFSVTENSNVITEGHWGLKIQDGNLFGLSMDNSSSFLFGRILLCDNQVLFNASYTDGSDNLFIRAK